MCGIIGVLASRPAAPIMLEALRRLEYRGYDSAGMATLTQGALARRRAPGKLAALAARLEADPLPGMAGVGHTRWATHGAPTEGNAHPHIVASVAVVHNGIIENWRSLRDAALAAGVNLSSDTDTEVVAAMVAQAMAAGADAQTAVATVLPRLRGAFALCFLFAGDQDLLIAARRGPPLAIGWGDGEMFVGSDALALAPLTRRVTYLEDGDWAVVTRAGATIHDVAGRAVNRPTLDVAASNARVEKDGFEHFMAKEIHEQPGVVSDALDCWMGPGRDRLIWPTSDAPAIDWAGLSRVTMIACGTAHYACHVAKYWFETVARLPVAIDVASEFRYRAPPLPDRGLFIAVSQSGETADTLAALRYARSQGQTTLGLVNVEGSSIARESDVALPIFAGPEIGVASTKAFTAQLTALACLTLIAAQARGAVDTADLTRLRGALGQAPRALTEAIACAPAIAALATEFKDARDLLFVGRGAMFPVALEGALKFKELTYLHAEGYAAGELKHGPIALLDRDMPVVALAPSDTLFEKTASNLSEIMARDARVALFGDAAAVAALPTWRAIAMPVVDPFAAPLVYAAAMQLLAYHAARARGADIDQPRNLAKSVTVE